MSGQSTTILQMPSASLELDLPNSGYSSGEGASKGHERSKIAGHKGGSGAIRPTLLIIASQPRCGSHMLGQMMYDDGRFGVPLEYFHKRHWKDWESRVCTESGGKDDVSAVAVLSRIMETRCSPQGIVTIKAHWHQVQQLLDVARDLIDDLLVARYVTLERRDLLGQAISFQIASQTGSWISTMPPQRKPKFSYEGIRDKMARIEEERSSWAGFIERACLPRLPLIYEDVVSAPAAALAAIASFAGLDSESVAQSAPSIPTKRQASQINLRWRNRFLAMERGKGN